VEGGEGAAPDGGQPLVTAAQVLFFVFSV
jgi:hypothetical protein